MSGAAGLQLPRHPKDCTPREVNKWTITKPKLQPSRNSCRFSMELTSRYETRCALSYSRWKEHRRSWIAPIRRIPSLRKQSLWWTDFVRCKHNYTSNLTRWACRKVRRSDLELAKSQQGLGRGIPPFEERERWGTHQRSTRLDVATRDSPLTMSRLDLNFWALHRPSSEAANAIRSLAPWSRVDSWA